MVARLSNSELFDILRRCKTPKDIEKVQDVFKSYGIVLTNEQLAIVDDKLEWVCGCNNEEL